MRRQLDLLQLYVAVLEYYLEGMYELLIHCKFIALGLKFKSKSNCENISIDGFDYVLPFGVHSISA